MCRDKDDGHMVASSNSITDYVPLDNMRAMINAAFEFGKYPIALEEGGVKGKVWKFQEKPKQKVEKAGYSRRGFVVHHHHDGDENH